MRPNLKSQTLIGHRHTRALTGRDPEILSLLASVAEVTSAHGSKLFLLLQMLRAILRIDGTVKNEPTAAPCRDTDVAHLQI